MGNDEIDADYIKKWSSFVLDDVFQRTEEMTEQLKKFQKDLHDECDDIEERIFVQNIISYLQWRLKERKNAFESVHIVEKLQNQPYLITHCNKIQFYKESGDHFLSNKLSTDLKNNDHFRQTRTKSEATAEIGYCFSRLGPKHHDSAVKLLKKAIANITHERNILWEYRLALTLRRQTHIFQMTTPKIFKPDETKEKAAQLFYQILKFKTEDTCSVRIKAKACCDLSTLLFRRENLYEIIHIDEEETKKITESWCFEEAMRLCPNEYFVVQQYGRYLRYTQDLKKSKDMLERAMQLKDTLFSRHHLALTLKRMVEMSIQKPNFGKKNQYPFSINDRDQSKHDSYDCNDRKGRFIATKKSPRIVCVSPNNPMLLEAVEHIQRAIKMSKEYDGTRYDLGLIYRMLDRSDDALKCFSFITSSNCGNPSDYPMYVINAYEQQSFCKLDLLAKETDPEKKKELRYDAEECAWKALTIVSGVIAAIPMLKRTNQCYPTLKELLQNEDNCLKTLNKLAKMNKMMHLYEESIELYKKIIKKEKDTTFVRKLAKTYIEMKDFKNAIYTLSLLLRTSEPSISDKSLFVTMCIEEAKRLLIENNDLEMAKIRFEDAYKAICSHQNVSTPRNEEDDTSLDILVLDSCGIDDCCYQNFVTSSLETFVQLKFVVNAFPGCLVLKYLDKAMEESHCILILQHESMSNADEKDKLIDLSIESAFLNHQAKILQVRKEDVRQYLPCCKEIVLTSDPSDIVNTDSRPYLLLKGNLFAHILHKLSDIFLG